MEEEEVTVRAEPDWRAENREYAMKGSTGRGNNEMEFGAEKGKIFGEAN